MYDVARKYFILTSLSTAPITFFVDAPFGRFAPSNDSIFLVDGIKSWIIMELVSPICFILAFLSSPPSTTPQYLLALLYLIHYANRALISPLRTPSRSKSHIIVPLSGVSFNIINGALMGTYLSSPTALAFLGPSLPALLTRPSFLTGITLWALGFAGNVYHDEILLTIRRKAISKGKAKAGTGEHYAIPQGALYTYLSYPNYFCEWVEWAGFALAASPLPFSLSALSLSSLPSPSSLASCVLAPASSFAPTLTPPHIFFITEVLLMLPRAVRGHAWYRQRFGAAYPPERSAVVPFLL